MNLYTIIRSNISLRAFDKIVLETLVNWINGWRQIEGINSFELIVM